MTTEVWKYPEYFKHSFWGKYPYHKVPDKKHFWPQHDLKYYLIRIFWQNFSIYNQIIKRQNFIVRHIVAIYISHGNASHRIHGVKVRGNTLLGVVPRWHCCRKYHGSLPCGTESRPLFICGRPSTFATCFIMS